MASTDVFEYDTPFTPTRPRKKRKNKNTPDRPNPQEVLERTKQELLAGEWAHDCKKLVRTALDTLSIQSPKVLCLGLGSPSSSRDARAQLAFLLEVCDDLTLERSNVSAYDPAFTDEDDQLLATLGMKRLPDSENRNAAYPLPEPTIVYMPHCDLQLYENLLRANWSRDRLPQLVLIANRFSEYLDSIPSHKLTAEHPRVSRIAPTLDSFLLPPCPTHPTAFNNLSIQFARSGALPDSLWEGDVSRVTFAEADAMKLGRC
ncbi:SRR1-domain-containing protein [Cytidiella melzeri]|nr:SRR1-domain-containing protein [Cytidiella melzeri]